MDNWGDEKGSVALEWIDIGGTLLRRGDRVRLQPKGRADAFDLFLAGHTATIEAIEQDFENQVYLAVTIDDDPGRDFGFIRQPGHRFFFTPEEVVLLGDSDRQGEGPA